MNKELAIQRRELKTRQLEVDVAREKIYADLFRDILNGVANIALHPIVAGIAGYYLIERIKDDVMENPKYGWWDRTSITAGYSGLQGALTGGMVAHGFGGVSGIAQIIKAVK